MVYVPDEYRVAAERFNRAVKVLALACVVTLLGCFVVAVAFGQDLPDPKFTFGVSEPKLTKDRLCAPGFTTKDWRHVSSGLKHKVYRAYGMDPHEGECALDRGCEVDHLIPIELGGANDIHNLWPQPFGTHPWNAEAKDQLENKLHQLVCAGDISLEAAQTEIKTDWTASWQKRFGREVP